MSDERVTFDLHNAHQGHEELLKLWRWCKPRLVAGQKLSIEGRPAKRTNDQNKMLWSILTDIAEQVDWPVDGATQKLDQGEWKDILTAGLKHEQRVARGISGGVVILGQRTSRMTRAELSNLMELAWAFGAQHDVKWSPTSLGRDGQPAHAERREREGEPA